MKDLRLELYNYKQKLSYEQYEISNIIESHMTAIGNHSEKQIISSLNEKLNNFKYDASVRNLLESLESELEANKLVYNLKELYNILEKQNQGMLYRQPMNILLETINASSDNDRISKILNELAIHDWIPEIKLFVSNLTTSPEQRNNLLSGGKSEPIFTLVEAVDNGFVAYVKDSWFLLSEGKIEQTLLENQIKDHNLLMTLRNVETALKYGHISEDRISFKLTENITVGISVKKKGLIYINDDEVNGETTLESLFNSPIIPLVSRNFYPLLTETINNIYRFVNLDIAKKITNLINPALECYVFNYMDSTYLYSCDERFGNSFFQYDSAVELVNEMKSKMNYDLTFFFEKQLEPELVRRKQLEDEERRITFELENYKFNISKLEASIATFGEREALTTALQNVKKCAKDTQKKLEAIKEQQYYEKTRKS